MSRDASGNYTLPGVVNPVVGGTPITVTWGNSTLADIQTAMTDSLDRNGRGSMLAPLKLTDGTAALPSLTFANDTNTGVYRIGNDSIGLSTGATLRLSINAAGLITAANDFTTNGALTVAGAATLNGAVTLGDAVGDPLTVAGSAVTWSGNPTHSGSHTFSGALTVAGAATLNGAVTLGDAVGDTLTIGGGSSKSATGSWVLAAPASGPTLTVNAVSGGTAGVFSTGAASNNAVTIQALTVTGRTFGFGINAAGGLNLFDNTSAAVRMAVSSAGDFAFKAASGAAIGSGVDTFAFAGGTLGHSGAQYNVNPAAAYEFVHRAAFGFDFFVNSGGTLALNIEADADINVTQGSGKLKMAGGITRFASAETTVPVVSGTTTIAHGGPRKPDVVYAVLRCLTAEHNWAVGDEVQVQSIGATQDIVLGGNATSVFLTQNRAAILAILNKTSGAPSTPTAANWRLVIYAHWL